MKQLYKVYERKNDSLPLVFINEPTNILKSKRIYTGKKAKIEAIFRLCGKKLPAYFTTSQVNEYIATNIFKTYQWDKYHRIFKEVANEVEIVEEHLQFKFDLLVDVVDGYSINDTKVIKDITSLLMGKEVCSKTVKSISINGK